MEPEQAEVYGIAAVDYPATAGIKAHMSVGVELSILILKAGGELIGGMKLELSANAGGKIKLKWTPMRGLEFIEAIAHAEASAQMILDLKGRLYADLDLLLKTINLWEQETTLAERQFGPQLKIGINVPLKVEDGKLKGIDFKDIEFIKPDLENKSEQDKLMENAIDESKKPPKAEPPGKEETLKMIRSLPAEASGGINIFRFSSERYSYIFKLQTQYPEQDWSFIFPELKKIENNELYNLRNAVFRIDRGFPGMSLVEYRLFMVNIFKKDHKYVDKDLVDTLRREVIDVGE
jgi:hypothetical protein